jgi:hypothetical protein
MSADAVRSWRRAAAGYAPWLSMALVLLACRAGAAGASSHHRQGVSVQVMVVGNGGMVLSHARSVLAGAGHVSLGGRSCAVAAATPLAALIALRHAGGPAFALRDYGHCGALPADSSQLFVTSVGGQRNGGQNGWVYKADGLTGSTGAADPSGPLGNGRRLQAGAKLLWFYCQMGAAGCQRTLNLVPRSATVAAGASLSVSVTGSDDQGSSSPIAGATVSLGSSTASSTSDGVASLTAPAVPGRYELSASGAGMVPSFPTAVLVR